LVTKTSIQNYPDCLVDQCAASRLPGFFYIDQKRDIDANSREGAEKTAKAAAKDVGEKVAKLEIAEILAREITMGTLTEEQIESRFNQEMVKNSDISSLTIVYLKGFVPESIRSFQEGYIYLVSRPQLEDCTPRE